jgi:glyoxylase-like metal-dependent hydrolase (beta-lactamase superfamily II)
MSTSWADAAPWIEPAAPGVEAVVVPSGASRFLSQDGLPVRAYVVGAPAGGAASEVAIIDAGYAHRLSVESITAAVAGRRVAAILLTHAHPDHAGGALALALRFGAPVRVRAEEAATRGADARLFSTGDGVLRALEEGEVIEVAGRRLRAVAAAGHTRGHVAFHDEREGLLFTGDTILGDGTAVVGPPDGDMTAYMATLEHLRALAPLRAILPGHGAPVSEPQKKIEQYVRHRRLREAQVLAALEEGARSADDLVRVIYEGAVPADLLPLARVSALGQLEKLVAEGRAVREGDLFRLARGAP